MASGGVFRRFIEIVLDKESAKKAERDTQAALNNATKPKTAAANLDSVGRAVTNVTRLFAQAGAAVVGYALAITRLTERGGQVLMVQRAFGNAVGDSEAAITKLRKATGGLISDYELMVGYNKALALGAVETVEQFGEMSKVAIELGRALGIDATYAMEQLSLGTARGSKKILDNLGIIIDGAITVEKVLAAANARVDEFGGTGASTADMLKRVTIQFGNLRDAVGKFLAQNQTLKTFFYEIGNVLETLVLALETDDLTVAKEAFTDVGMILGASFASGFSSAAKTIFEQLLFKKNAMLPGLIGGAIGAGVGSMAGGVGALPGAAIGAQTPELAGRLLVRIFGDMGDAAARVADENVTTLGALREQLLVARRIAAENPLTRRMGAHNQPTPLSPEEIRRIQDERLKLLVQAADLGILNQREHAELARIISIGNDRLKDGNLTLEERIRILGRVMDAEEAIIALKEKKEREEPVPKAKKEREEVDAKTKEKFDEDPGPWKVRFDDIQSAAVMAADEIDAAWSRLFADMKDGGADLGDFMGAIAEGIGAGFAAAIANVAHQKVRENLAYAIEEGAHAIKAFATGNVPGGLAHAKSALEFGAAAVAWGTVSGLSGGSGGGSSSVGDFRGSDQVRGSADKVSTTAPEIHIYVDGIDPRNPTHQNLVWQTAAQASERYGGNARVTFHGRNG